MTVLMLSLYTLIFIRDQREEPYDFLEKCFREKRSETSTIAQVVNLY